MEEKNEVAAFSENEGCTSAAVPTTSIPTKFLREESRKLYKFKSSPSPFDGILYAVFKRCPALLPALHNIFNFCWLHSTVPSAWKLAAVKLIAKSSAEADPSSPTNFRPIALTSCVGKLFSTILRNRWLNYMITNMYFNKSVQKRSCQPRQAVLSITSSLLAS